MSDNDELVSQFLAFTGSSDTERAASYLEMSNNDLQTAVGLYLEHQAGGGGAASGGSGMGASGIGGDDEVRAPDATRTMRLMDDPGPAAGLMMGGNNPYMAMNSMLSEQLATSAFARDAVNSAVAAAAAADDESMEGGEDEKEDDEDGEDNGRKKKAGVAGLADMFAPPHHLMYKEGGFEGARTMAKDNKRWLLVNLQRDSEFSCHALNRDVWRDELVENLIREGFIFWQEMDVAPEGAIYAERYKVFDFPHIGIIDPRTRRLLWKKEGWTQQNPLTAEQFAETAMDFCSRHSFDKPPQAPRPNSAAARPTKRPMHEMSEEEQLQAAMRESLKESGANLDDDGDDDEDEYIMEEDDDDDVQIVAETGAGGDSKPQAVDTKEEKPKPAAPSMLDQLLALDLGDEPEKGARIQFRMPDGKRKIRKFDPSQNVRLIYAFVAQSMPESKDGKEFVLMAGFPPKDLITDIDNTIDSCSLSGEAITVRWK
eukprot:CAMPEP_0178734778 /NCGR_PEP_ID=MMETSP0744-20121128/1533_1 /TAXON_ID=913974 /ORGANISM="Nitzschia punctata, Strain CCMP561" /LENGTH=483 /DNA_ID=CAMNT_0020387097 /DNA_START=15 /DNA_END=1466 /DNA_ORIENTATION=+